MATNLIQIKRSDTTATPTLLANGELAWSGVSNTLFIGSNNVVIPIAGSRTPGTLTANQALVANSTSGIDRIITANAIVTTLTANGTTGTAGQILTSNGTTSHWANPANSSFTIAGDTGSDVVSTGQTLSFLAANGLTTAVTDNQVAFSVDTGTSLTVNATGIHVNAGNLSIATSQLTGDVELGTSTSGNYVATITAGAGISGSSSSEGGTPTIAVVANNGIVANSTGTFAAGANGISVDAAGINVVGGNGLVANSTGVHVGQSNGIAVDADAIRVAAANGISVIAGGVTVTGGPTLTVNATGVHVNSSLSITDLTLAGNLTVSGTLTTIDTVNLTVQDSLIELANGNVSTDALDIGFYGQYGETGTKFTGMFRDATDGIYKLYSGLTAEPTTTVDTANASYTQATLQSFLISGGLVSNSTAVTLTANSTLAVNLTANSLTLSTPLATTSGGTGLNSYTTGDILVATGTNTLSKLALATEGRVLMSNGTALVYDTLDGGTF
jgi:hypothetical protein